MPLTIDDIQLLASERMTDLEDGGGRVTGNVIQDGVENNVFPDVSSDDRASGRVRIRKVYSAIRNNDTDPLLGARAAITRGPTDPAISAALFSPGSWEDERSDAVDYLEQYWTGGSTTGFWVGAGGGVQGAETVTVYHISSPATDTPEVGDRFWVEGQVLGIVAVGPSYSEFSPPLGGNRTHWDLTLSRPLTANLTDHEDVRAVTASGLMRVYGIAPITAALTADTDNVVTVSTTYVQIVPELLGASYEQIQDLIGLDPLMFPEDGKVSFVGVGYRAMVHHTDEYEVENPAQAEAVYDVGRTNLAWLGVFDQSDTVIPTDRYTADLPAGTITMAAGLDLTGYTQPLIIRHTIIDEADITAVDHGAVTVTLAATVTRSYPASGAYLSTVLRHGDMFARTTVPFAQTAWTGVWSDSRIGSAPAAQYDHTLHPITVTNDGALKQRWRINFTSSTAFQLIGETVGVIAAGDINTLFAPLNPRTSQPYLTIPAAGWGTGWQPGNQLRVNSEPADYPLYALQCVTPSAPNGTPDEFRIEQIGDIDA